MVEQWHVQNAEGELLAIVNSSPLAIVAVSTEGAVTMWNPAAERMFFWAAAEVMGGPVPCIPPEDLDDFAAVLRSVLDGEEVQGLEVARVRKDGSRIDVDLSLAPQRDQAGHVFGAVGILADISDRKTAERAMRQSDHLLQVALVSGRMAVASHDLVTDDIVWSGSPEDLFGGHAPPEVGREVPELVHPDDRGLIEQALDARRNDDASDVEVRVIGLDGAVRWITSRGAIVRDEAGRPVRSVRVLVDTSERKHREEELRRTTETLRGIVAASPLAIATTDVDGRVTMWSPAAEETFGWSAVEVLGGPLPFLPDGESETLGDLRARVLTGEVVIDQEAEPRRKDGTLLTVSLSLAPVRDGNGFVSGIVGLLTDISDRKRVEAEIAVRNAELSALQESLVLETARFNDELRRSARDLELLYNRERDTRETLSAIVTASPLAIVAIDADRRVTMWNPAAEEMFGWVAEEVLLGPVPYLPPDALDTEELQDRALSGEVILDEKATHVRKDGHPLDVSLSLAPLRDGHVTGAVAVVADITERLKAERELRDAEDRYRTLVEQIPAIVYIDVTDGKGTTLYVSPQVEEFLGLTQEEWMQASFDLWLEHVHPDDRPQVVSAYLHTVESGEPLDVEYRMVRRDGRVLWFSDQAQVLPENDGRLAQIHGVMLDITELKRAEAEVAQNIDLLQRTDLERRRLLSRLVSAQEEERRRIASDMHDDTIQAMTAVGLRLAVLRGQLGKPGEAPSPKVFDDLELSVGAAIGRLRRLLFELRPPELDRGGLASALASQLEQARSDFEIAVRLENRLTTEPSSEARTVAYRIAQEALANVRRHARATCVEVDLESEDDGVLVQVRDDGQGFAVEEAFEQPAFGHLGLIAMRERAELAGGWLRVSSERGAGTTVEFWIPLSFEPLAEEPAS